MQTAGFRTQTTVGINRGVIDDKGTDFPQENMRFHNSDPQKLNI